MRNVYLHEVGLMDRDGELALSVCSGHSGKAHFAGAITDHTAITVPVRNAQSFVHDVVGDRPFGAKIDVEGAELLILSPLLQSEGLRFVVFECGRHAAYQTVWERIDSGGFALFGISKGRRAVRLSRLSEAGEMSSYSDLVAVSRDPRLGDEVQLVPRELARLIA
jgi:hypothetical protein